MIYTVYIKVYSQVGKFTGYISQKFETESEALLELVNIQVILTDENFGSITFYSDENGSEITVLRSMMKLSIFELSVIEYIQKD